MTFKKGESGNPAGRRPKDQARLDDALATATASVERLDSWINFATALGTDRDKRTHGFHAPDIVSDIEAMGLWRSDDMCKRVIEMVPLAAFRRGFSIKCEDKELSEKIHSDLEDLRLTETFTRACMYENAFGGSALLPITSDVGDLSEPLDENAITEVSAIHLFEPRELWTTSYCTDIRSPKYGTPETYRLVPLGAQQSYSGISQVIHESRLIVFPGRRISRQLQPGQRAGWGDSVLSTVYSVIRDFAGAWGSTAALLEDFAQGVLKLAGFKDLMKDADGEAVAKKRLAMMDMWRSTMRMMVVDEGDDFQRTSTPVGGLEGLLQQFALRISAAAETPVTVMFGMAPAGLNATGDNDIRGWYDNISARREHHFRCRLEHAIKLYMLSKDGATGGVEPEMWSVEFPPLWEPSEKERADTRFVISQTDKNYYDIGAASSDDIAESRWKGDTFSADMSIDWDEREKQAKLEAKKEDMAAVAALKAQANPVAPAIPAVPVPVKAPIAPVVPGERAEG